MSKAHISPGDQWAQNRDFYVVELVLAIDIAVLLFFGNAGLQSYVELSEMCVVRGG